MSEPFVSRTLVEAVLQAGARFPSRGITLVDSRGRLAGRRSYSEVAAGALLAAGRLAGWGLRPGDRLLVCLPTSWEFLDAWLGALLAGVLPVAMAPPAGVGAASGHLARVAAIRERLGGLVVAPAALREAAREAGLGELTAAVLTPDELVALTPYGRFRPVEPEPGEIAFLQLTSGSTGLPRAVAISHGAAVHNGWASSLAIGAPWGGPVHEWAESMVSWLPLHHDMGLVGCLFLCLGQGLDLVLMSPTTFLARPQVWLEHLGKAGSTFAPAPNFGYQLCAERLVAGDLAGLDLSRWRAAMTGAEMVRPETVEAFAALTAGCGFEPEAFRPCYGLAEATLAVTFDVAGRGLRTLPVPAGVDAGFGLSEVVCLGEPVAETEVRIAAPDGAALAAGEVGEVWVRGPGIFSGYVGDPEATAESLRGGWLVTGDLGLLVAGELYLTGRTKDLLILRGHNLMPHELEWLAEAVVGGGGALRSGAFSVARGAEGEEAVLVVETGERDSEALRDLAREVRLRVANALSLPLADVVFVRRGKIPKTTSGKVQRRELRARYLAGELERIEL